MTIRQHLQKAQERLIQSQSARLDAQLLLCRVLGVEKSYLVAHDDRLLTDEEAAHYADLLARRQQGEPIAYILGTRGFYDLEFVVTPAVLIPRPETEHLIEAALEWSQDRQKLTAADIGTGSGAIAVTFARHRPQAEVHAVDISNDALAIAQKNARNNRAAVHFHQGNLAQPLIDAGIRIDLLMANLPYIRQGEIPDLAVSKHEPLLALDGGEDGLDLVRELLRQVPLVCAADGLILLEIGAEQGLAVLEATRIILPTASAAILKDYAGQDRIIRIERSSTKP